MPWMSGDERQQEQQGSWCRQVVDVGATQCVVYICYLHNLLFATLVWFWYVYVVIVAEPFPKFLVGARRVCLVLQNILKESIIDLKPIP